MDPRDRTLSARSATPPRPAHRTFRIAAALLCALIASPALAEPLGSYLYFVPFGGYASFPEHVRFSIPGSVADEFYVGGRLGYQTTRWLGIELAGGFSPTSEVFHTGTAQTGTTVEKDLNFMNGSAD